MFLVSEETLSLVRHDSPSLNQPLASSEIDALRKDEATRSVFEARETIDQKIRELFDASYNGQITTEQFSEQYGVWIRIRKCL